MTSAMVILVAYAAALVGLCLGQEATAATKSSGKTLHIVRGLKNVSKETGDFLKLKCEVEASEGGLPATEFRWLVNDALLVEEKNRIKVKTNLEARPQYSTLRIRELETLDKAFYKCIATNGVDTVSSQVLYIYNWILSCIIIGA